MGVDISVVVPVYNTSRFLPQCVESLLNQTWKNVEFIFVDDGSTDESVEILEQYRARDARISILRQENLHAGVARNNGMKRAKGKYIIFLDSDDYFDLTLLERAFRCAEENRAEIVFFGYNTCDLQTGAIEKRLFRMRKGVFSGESLGDAVFSTFLCVPWNRLLLRSFVEKYHLEFQAIHKHTDVYFGRLSVALAERIVCIREPLVYYRINNPESLQGQKLPAYPYITEAYSALKQSLKAHGKFHGGIRDGYNKILSSIIERWAFRKKEEMLSKDYYTAMKQNLVPRLFDFPEDVLDKAMIPGLIFRSADYESYLVSLFETMAERQKGMVSKKSRDYIVGHALLTLPRFIKNKIWHRLRTGGGA